MQNAGPSIPPSRRPGGGWTAPQISPNAATLHFLCFPISGSLYPISEQIGAETHVKEHDISMIAANDDHHTSLRYRALEVSTCQARFEGRQPLYPVLDLRLFTCRAVVDWVDIGIETIEPTQGLWINRLIKQTIDISCRVTPHANNAFSIRFQEPNFRLVRRAIDVVKQRSGLAGDATIVGIEVSVDFTPKTPGNVALRRKLVGVLWRHLLPNRQMFERGVDMPRFTWGNEQGPVTAGIHPRRKNGPPIPHLLLANGDDYRPFADATVYFGEKDAPPSWRLMDKILDRQNPGNGSRLELPEHEKRVRVEVTLSSNQLGAFGVRRMDDLATFNFCSLASEHFRFVAPTFVDPDAVAGCRRKVLLGGWERERITKFLNTGVIGLEAMDRQWEILRAKNRPAIVKEMGKRGLRLERKRAGTGKTRTFVAFAELNKRIEVAFRKLTERTVAQLNR